MVKTGNRIYKNSVTKLLQIRVAAVFIPYFFHTVHLQLWPGTRTLSFLTRQPQTSPYIVQIRLWFIDIDRKYLCKKIYFRVVEHTFFPVCLKYQGWALCVCPRSCWFEEISVVSLFLLANRTGSMIIDHSLRCRDKCVGFILYTCLHRTRSYFSPLYRTITP